MLKKYNSKFGTYNVFFVNKKVCINVIGVWIGIVCDICIDRRTFPEISAKTHQFME